MTCTRFDAQLIGLLVRGNYQQPDGVKFTCVGDKIRNLIFDLRKRRMEVWISKVICLFILFLIALVFGLLPIRFVAYLKKKEEQDVIYGRIAPGRSNKAKAVLAYMNCFAGGVFMGTCLLHLFPEVKEKYDKLVEDDPRFKSNFPLSELIIACGFFLIMIIEHVAMSCHQDNTGPIDLVNITPTTDSGVNTEGNEERMPILQRSISNSRTYNTTNPNMEINSPDINHLHQYGGSGSYNEGRFQRNSFASGSFAGNSFASWYECDSLPPHHHHPGQTHEETEHIHTIRSFMLLLALSMHTAFEGLALGLESTASSVWLLFAALSVHKSLISFTMGLQFTDTFQNQTNRVVLYIFVFSLVCPIGVGIGTGISAVKTSALAMDIVSMCLEGLAAGTFLYVTFFEVLQKELGVEEHSISKVLAIICGFALIASTMFLES